MEALTAGRGRSALALLLLGAVAYAGVLGVPFHYDDVHVLTQNDRMAREGLSWALTHIRPLTYLSFWMELRCWGTWPPPYHAMNLLLHLANGMLLWRILARLGGHGGGPAAWLAAALFLVHPLQTEGVSYVSSRADLLSALLLLLGGYGLVAGRPARAGLRAAALAGAGALSILAKESGAIFPFWYLLLGAAAGRAREALRLCGWMLACLAGIALVQAVWAGHAHLSRTIEAAGGWQASLSYAATQATVWPRYLGMALLPAGQTINPDLPLLGWPEGIDPSRPFSIGAMCSAIRGLLAANALPIAKGIALLAALAAGLRLAAGSWRVWGTGMAWFALALIPSSSLVPLKDPFQEHRAYLAAGGVLWIAGVFAARASQGERRRLAGVFAAALIGVSAVATWGRNAVWRDPAALWGEAVRLRPGNPRAHLNLGVVWAERGMPLRAERAYLRAQSFDGMSAGMRLATLRNLFLGAVARGGFADAGAHLARIRGLAGPDLRGLVALWGDRAFGMDAGLCRWAQSPASDPEGIDWAIRYLALCAPLEPSPGPVLGNLGGLLFLRGRFPEALSCYERAAAAVPPGDAGFERAVRISLARTLLRLDRAAEAADHLRRLPDEGRSDPEGAELWRRIERR